MPSYKDSDDYKTYKEGLLQGGKNHRMEDLPPFEFNEINFAEMRRAAGFPAKGKCTYCTTARNAKCPPALRDQECEVWARFEDDEEDEA
ncbi:uncharacterized protein CTRU02_210990 [Colletotrichum truncatum]|uniref:Uncharacterized protein n=1 Tax=Colletotrichum truncatum TaxID=5467 RepID=A0ACC3YRU6_COLTU|nr:uncharacterized protein CTRU02_03527 [Colletotrichum truncatum]KAF6796549.1 hypothetical protein CTRU02_03527 [Colletotrichum truncatum]